MRGYDDRRGTSLVELLVVTVLGALVLASVYEVLITNRRVYAAQNTTVDARQTLRTGMGVLTAELRELSPADGDLVSIEPRRVKVRASRALALVCSVPGGGIDPLVRARRVGLFLREDSVRVFFDNDPNTAEDDLWRAARLEVVDTTGTVTCADGTEAQDVRLHGVSFGTPPDSITAGALIRNVVHREYALEEYEGRSYLVRTDGAGTLSPLVGPLDVNGGLRLRYFDALGEETSVKTEVRQIEVTLARTSPASGGGGPPKASLVSRIHTRN